MARLRSGAAALLTCCALWTCAAAETGGPTVTAADFVDWEADLLRHGKLRTERRPADAPVSNDRLVSHFARVAFRVEAAANGGSKAHRLYRREGPVRWWVFAEGSDAGAASADVARTFERFASLTGLDVGRAASAETANFHLLFLRARDYRAAVDWASAALDRRDAEFISEFRTRQTLCAASVVLGRPGGARQRAIVLVRAGYSDLLRLGCVEEEIAQALGLPNDDSRVRPSIFNDDEEFALLTEHDEMLLRILYDPRLRRGMTLRQAMPRIWHIVEELRPGK